MYFFFQFSYIFIWWYLCSSWSDKSRRKYDWGEQTSLIIDLRFAISNFQKKIYLDRCVHFELIDFLLLRRGSFKCTLLQFKYCIRQFFLYEDIHHTKDFFHPFEIYIKIVILIIYFGFRIFFNQKNQGPIFKGGG